MHIVVVAMARRGAAARMRKGADLYCHNVVENLIARVDREYVVK